MMATTRLLHLGLALALLADLLLLPAHLRLYGLLGTTLAFGLLIAYLVSSPRSQSLVPTLYRGPRGGQQLALTFDDGPDPRWTPLVLDRLAARGAKASFFVVGARAERHPELVARAAREGHTIGCHTYSHSHGFHLWSGRKMAADIERAQAVLAAQLGAPSTWFRPPQGLRVPQLQTALSRLTRAVHCVTWTARGLDSRATAPQRIVQRLRPAVHDGAILTLHDGTGLGGGHDRSATLDALDELLTLAESRGLRCVSLATLFAETEHV